MVYALLVSLVACSAGHTPPAGGPAAGGPAAGGPAAAPTTTAASTDSASRTLTLDPSLLRYDDAAGTVAFTPDSRRQTDTYTTYVLDLGSLEAVLGGRPTAEVAVVVTLGAPTTRTAVPEDPNVPQPTGGFTYITYTGRVVAKGP